MSFCGVSGALQPCSPIRFCPLADQAVVAVRVVEDFPDVHLELLDTGEDEVDGVVGVGGSHTVAVSMAGRAPICLSSSVMRSGERYPITSLVMGVS